MLYIFQKSALPEHTQEEFLSDFDERYPGDDAWDTLLIFADWLEEQSNQADADFCRGAAREEVIVHIDLIRISNYYGEYEDDEDQQEEDAVFSKERSLDGLGTLVSMYGPLDDIESEDGFAAAANEPMDFNHGELGSHYERITVSGLGGSKLTAIQIAIVRTVLFSD